MGMDLGGPEVAVAAKWCAGIVLFAAFVVGFVAGFAACVFL